jgi:hypothetical protein
MLDYLLPGLAIAYPAGDRVLRIRDAQCELIDPQRGRCGDAVQGAAALPRSTAPSKPPSFPAVACGEFMRGEKSRGQGD